MTVYGSGGDYGSGPGMGQGGYGVAVYPPKVRFDVIGEAWSLVQEQMGTWVLSILVLYAVIIALSGGLGFVQAMLFHPTGGRQNTSAGAILFQIATSLLSNAVTYFLMGGVYRMALKQIRREPISVGDVFSAGDVWLPLFLNGLLYGLAVTVGLVFCIVPGFLAAGLLMLAPLLIVDGKERGPVSALNASYNALRSDLWNAALFTFVLGLLAGIGLLACGVGALFTYPLYFLGMALVYRDFFLGGVPPQAGYPGMPGGTGPANPWAMQAPPATEGYTPPPVGGTMPPLPPRAGDFPPGTYNPPPPPSAPGGDTPPPAR